MKKKQLRERLPYRECWMCSKNDIWYPRSDGSYIVRYGIRPYIIPKEICKKVFEEFASESDFEDIPDKEGDPDFYEVVEPRATFNLEKNDEGV